MDEKLKVLIKNFNKKFEEAQDARTEVLDFLEEKYGIDTREESDTIEESCSWCYGLDVAAIEKLIIKSDCINK